MAATIAPKSDQLNADDLIAGPRTITITAVKARHSTPDQPIAVHFEGDNGKPYLPCKSMRRVMVAVWGVDPANYVGQAMTLFRDPSVLFGGIAVGGIRISHMSGIDGPKMMALTASKTKRAQYTVEPLANAPKKKAEAKPAGPKLAIVGKNGLTHTSPANWEKTLIGAIQTLPFDKAKAVYDDNAEHIEAAKATHPSEADAVEAAWQKRKDEAESAG